MRTLFGVVSLVVVLALVGLLAARQLKALNLAQSPAGSSSASPASSASRSTANVREQSQQLQQQVKDDVARALDQGAASRAEAADQ